MDFNMAITPWAAEFQQQIQRAGHDQPTLPAALQIGHRRPAMSGMDATRNTWVGFQYKPLSAPVQSRLANPRRMSEIPEAAEPNFEGAVTGSQPRHTYIPLPPAAELQSSLDWDTCRNTETPDAAAPPPQTMASTTVKHPSYKPARTADVLQPPPKKDHEQTSLVLAIINASKTMSLRKWIWWIIKLREIHDYQSINHVQPKDANLPTAPAIMVLRNLAELLLMYLPGRVMLPNREAWDCVETIHGILREQKHEMEDRYQEIEQKSRTSPMAFLEFLSYSYKVVGVRLKLAEPGIFHKPDRLDHQIREIDKALFFYSFENSDVLFDQSATNTLSDVIRAALRRCRASIETEIASRSGVHRGSTGWDWLDEEIYLARAGDNREKEEAERWQLKHAERVIEKAVTGSRGMDDLWYAVGFISKGQKLERRRRKVLQAEETIRKAAASRELRGPKTPDRLLFQHAGPHDGAGID